MNLLMCVLVCFHCYLVCPLLTEGNVSFLLQSQYGFMFIMSCHLVAHPARFLELDVDINNYLSELNEGANEVKVPLGVRSELIFLWRRI